MPKLLMLRGLPGSGKSTEARELVEKQGYVRVNKDELREMLNNGNHSQSKENLVIEIRDSIIISALRSGRNVVVDDTNIHPKHEARLREITAAYNEGTGKKVSFSIKCLLLVPIEYCINNDLNRLKSVGEQVIRKMDEEARKNYPELYPIEAKVVPYPRNSELFDSILCDLDGTLALITDRNPYDASMCENDKVNEAVATCLRNHALSFKIFFMSGRSDKYREQTEKWLADHGLLFGPVYMRKEGDDRKDSIVKHELFDAHIKGQYNVSFVLDDRDQVVEKWREMGLTCFQVNYGNF